MRLRADADLTDIAQAFIKLHARRETADYDHTASFDKRTTLLDLAVARRATNLSFTRRDSDNYRASPVSSVCDYE